MSAVFFFLMDGAISVALAHVKTTYFHVYSTKLSRIIDASLTEMFPFHSSGVKFWNWKTNPFRPSCVKQQQQQQQQQQKESKTSINSVS